MAVSLLKQSAGPDRILVLDLADNLTKAVLLARTKDGFVLQHHCFFEAASAPLSMSQGALTEHLRKLRLQFKGGCTNLIVVVGMDKALLRLTQTPRVPRAELRNIIKFNPQVYFPSPVKNHVFDCCIPSSEIDFFSTDAKRHAQALVAAIDEKTISLLEGAAKGAGLNLLAVTCTQASLATTVQLALPEKFRHEVLALVDLGCSMATISFVVDGITIFTRTIEAGGDNLRAALVTAFKVPSSVAAEYKNEIIRSQLEGVLAPVADEFYRAIQFFEAEFNHAVTHGYISGDLARSQLLVETLQYLRIPCEALAPPDCIRGASPEVTNVEIPKSFPQLSIALGAGVDWLTSNPNQINFLSESIARREERRRDPVRRVAIAAGAALLVFLSWTAFTYWQLRETRVRLAGLQPDFSASKKIISEASALGRAAGEMDRRNQALGAFVSNRVFTASALDVLQHTFPEDVQLLSLGIEHKITTTPGSPKGTGPNGAVVPAKPGFSSEQTTFNFMARNFGEPKLQDKFIHGISVAKWFQAILREEDSVLLKKQLPRQVDPEDPTNSFTIFEVEAVSAVRLLGYE